MTTADPAWGPAMAFDGVTLSPRKEVVRKFYKDMSDHADLFHEGFTFRGSLGPPWSATGSSQTMSCCQRSPLQRFLRLRCKRRAPALSTPG